MTANSAPTPVETVIANLRENPSQNCSAQSETGRDDRHYVALGLRIDGKITTGILELANRPGNGVLVYMVVAARREGGDVLEAAKIAQKIHDTAAALVVDDQSNKVARKESREVEFGKKSRASQRQASV